LKAATTRTPGTTRGGRIGPFLHGPLPDNSQILHKKEKKKKKNNK
jgi:hypothetical protein